MKKHYRVIVGGVDSYISASTLKDADCDMCRKKHFKFESAKECLVKYLDFANKIILYKIKCFKKAAARANDLTKKDVR